MRLKEITATPHPSGNRIDLRWTNPEPEKYSRVRVVRQEGTFPTSPADKLFNFEANVQSDLDREELPLVLSQEFADNGLQLKKATVVVKEEGRKWYIVDGERKYVIRRQDAAFTVYDESKKVTDTDLDTFRFSLETTSQNGASTIALFSALRSAFLEHDLPLSGAATLAVEPSGRRWKISDGGQVYVVAQREGRLDVYDATPSIVDEKKLKGETVYYYTLFSYQNQSDPLDAQLDPHNRAAAMATAPYDMAGQMYDLLPGLYHRYDTALPEPDEVAEADRDKGQLRRFLDLPGGQLDQLYSLARAALNLHDVEKVDGRLLPLLAQWIGWQTDHRKEIDTQRNEIRGAPYVYRRVGIVPTAEAAVKRILGWESRTKEYVHNVFLSNRPERLNLWARERELFGKWSEPTQPLSLDFAYEGRPSVVHDGSGTRWLFYHTRSQVYRSNDSDREQWDIWYKILSTFALDDGDERLREALQKGIISAGLQQAFEAKGFVLSEGAEVEVDEGDDERDGPWRITDLENGATYEVKADGDTLNVRRWAASRPLTYRRSLDKHPTAAVQGDRLWVFWNAYDEKNGVWYIDGRTRTSSGKWTDIESFPAGWEGDNQPERKRPWAVADNKEGLWLFWLEKGKTGWHLKYNRRDGNNWQSTGGVSFPSDGNPRVQSDLFVLFNDPPRDLKDPPSLWVFWARQVPVEGPDGAASSNGTSNQKRWQIAYRIKELVSTIASGQGWSLRDPWGPVCTLTSDDGEENPTYDDREPAAWADSFGNIHLFWSSNRDGSWSIWQRQRLRELALPVEPPGGRPEPILGERPDTIRPPAETTYSWGNAEPVTAGPYSQRDPLPMPLATFSTLLVYHSNRSLTHPSAVYRATETLDARYAGCTAVDTRNRAKIALRGGYDDFQTYTYFTGAKGERVDQDRYARGTVGFFLDPETEDPSLVELGRDLIERALRPFLPIQVRPVFVISIVTREMVYTYDFDDVEPQRVIGEAVWDSILPETYLGLGDAYQDAMISGWKWVYSWPGEPKDGFPEDDLAEKDVTNNPAYRTWHVGLGRWIGFETEGE